jgi:hypothetical protein
VGEYRRTPGSEPWSSTGSQPPLRSRTSRNELSSIDLIVSPFTDGSGLLAGEIESDLSPALAINTMFDKTSAGWVVALVFVPGVVMSTVLDDALWALLVRQFVLEALHAAI